jgi:integrase
VGQLSAAVVVSYREGRLAQGLSPRTLNGEVGALGSMLNWGVDPGKLIGSNPIAGLKPLPHLNPKEGRPLTDEEARKLLAASPPHWRDIWYAFLTTGLRKSELAGLQFTSEFLDLPARELIIPPWLAKNGIGRRIPMDDGLYEIIKRLEAGRAARQPGKGRGKISAAQVQARFTRDYIFVTTENTPLDHKGNLWRAFVSCLKKAKIERQTFSPDGRLLEHVDIHSMRRTFATSLIVSGADPKTVQELLGHKTLAMTMKVYAKVRSQTKQQAIARHSGRLRGSPDAPLALSPLPEQGAVDRLGFLQQLRVVQGQRFLNVAGHEQASCCSQGQHVELEALEETQDLPGDLLGLGVALDPFCRCGGGWGKRRNPGRRWLLPGFSFNKVYSRTE